MILNYEYFSNNDTMLKIPATTFLDRRMFLGAILHRTTSLPIIYSGKLSGISPRETVFPVGDGKCSK